MTDWTDLPNTAVGVGGIPSGTTVTALRDNPIAIAEGAAGAPKIVPSALVPTSTTFVARSVNVTYTNSLDYPIYVSANFRTTDNQTRSISGQVNYGAGLVATDLAEIIATDGVTASVFFVVPAGSQWRAFMPNTSDTVQRVTEFR